MDTDKLCEELTAIADRIQNVLLPHQIIAEVPRLLRGIERDLRLVTEKLKEDHE